jgi:hypothetical protein
MAGWATDLLSVFAHTGIDAAATFQCNPRATPVRSRNTSRMLRLVNSKPNTSALHWWRQMLALLALVLAAACQGPEILSPQQGGALVHKTKVGMSKDEIVGQLGRPHKEETYGATEFLFYNANWIMADAALQRSPVVIVSGKVVAFGKSYYDAFIKSQNNWEGEVGVTQSEWYTTVKP